MTTAQVLETPVTVNNCPIHDYNLDYHASTTYILYELTPEFKPFTPLQTYHNWNCLLHFLWKFLFNCVVLIQTHCCFSPSRYVTHIPVYCIFLWLLPTLFLLVVLGSEVEADYLLCLFITRKPRWTEHVTDFRLDVQVKVLLLISFPLTYMYSMAQK